VAVKWPLKNGEHQYFVADVKEANQIDQSFTIAYRGVVEKTEHEMDVKARECLPWHIVVKKRVEDIEEGDHLALYHLEEGQGPVIYEAVVKKVNAKPKGYDLLFAGEKETETYSLRSLKRETWHQIPEEEQGDLKG
jgi:hypothetical protein